MSTSRSLTRRVVAGSVLLAIALAACGESDQQIDAVQDVPGTTREPPDAAPAVDEALAATPRSGPPGTRVSLSPPSDLRARFLYGAEIWTGSEWEARYFLNSDKSPAPFNTLDVRLHQNVGIADVAYEGLGPDLVEIPAGADSGVYRICSTNARQYCSTFEVSDPTA